MTILICYFVIKQLVLHNQWHNQFCVDKGINLSKIWGSKAGGSISPLNLHRRLFYLQSQHCIPDSVFPVRFTMLLLH